MRTLLTVLTLLTAVTVMTLGVPGRASAILPPLKIAKERLAQARSDVNQVLRVTVTATDSGKLREYVGAVKPGAQQAKLALRGKKGAALTLAPTEDLPERLLWIALLAKDPVDAVEQFGRIDEDQAEYVVEGDFVAAYGESPRILASRKLDRLRGFEIRQEKSLWAVDIRYGESGLPERVLISRDGRSRLTAVVEPAE